MLVGETAFRYAPGLLPLHRIAGYSGSNKARLAEHGIRYLDVYEHHLRHLRRQAFSLLELGVYRGESLRMWRTYFPRATVFGLDIDPTAASRAPGFRVFIGSQADAELVDSALKEIGHGLRVVVDDASHVNTLTVASFDLIFPRLASGGWYFIEDLVPGSYESALPSWPGMEHNEGLELRNRRADIDELLIELGHDVDGFGSGRWGEGRVAGSIHVSQGLIAVQRV